jgi:acyl carrier protein
VVPFKRVSSVVRRQFVSCPAARHVRSFGLPMAAPPPLDTDAVTAALVAFINSHIMAAGRPITATDSFEAAGIDSMALLKILLHVEGEFGLWIPDEDLVDEHIACARSLAEYLCRRASAA